MIYDLIFSFVFFFSFFLFFLFETANASPLHLRVIVGFLCVSSLCIGRSIDWLLSLLLLHSAELSQEDLVFIQFRN